MSKGEKLDLEERRKKTAAREPYPSVIADGGGLWLVAHSSAMLRPLRHSLLMQV